jgi:hypothetical protein
MERHGVLGLLSKVWIPDAERSFHPFFIRDAPFRGAVESLLTSLEAAS